MARQLRPGLTLALLAAAAVIMPVIQWQLARADAQLRSDLIQRGVRVPGFVSTMSFGKHGCGARFSYTTRDGRSLDRCYGNGLPFPERAAITTGAAVDVVYDPDAPDRAIPEPLPAVPQIDAGAWGLRMAGFDVLIFGMIASILLIRMAFSGNPGQPLGASATRN